MCTRANCRELVYPHVIRRLYSLRKESGNTADMLAMLEDARRMSR